MNKYSVRVIIPAFNEEAAIRKVIDEIPNELVSEIIVVDNNSTDKTSDQARKAGATVLKETKIGYGYACLRGIEYISQSPEQTDVIIFIDGDYSDYPSEMKLLIEKIEEEDMDLVIGSRVLGNNQKGSMTIPQVFGNWLATALIKLFFGVRFTDLGPFRSIKMEKLMAMNMQDKTFGWTVEMQVKAAKMKMKCTEIPVSYRKRIGTSKVSGTVKGTVLAGYKILWTIFKLL